MAPVLVVGSPVGAGAAGGNDGSGRHSTPYRIIVVALKVEVVHLAIAHFSHKHAGIISYYYIPK